MPLGCSVTLLVPQNGHRVDAGPPLHPLPDHAVEVNDNPAAQQPVGLAARTARGRAAHHRRHEPGAVGDPTVLTAELRVTETEAKDVQIGQPGGYRNTRNGVHVLTSDRTRLYAIGIR